MYLCSLSAYRASPVYSSSIVSFNLSFNLIIEILLKASGRPTVRWAVLWLPCRTFNQVFTAFKVFTENTDIRLVLVWLSVAKYSFGVLVCRELELGERNRCFSIPQTREVHTKAQKVKIPVYIGGKRKRKEKGKGKR